MPLRTQVSSTSTLDQELFLEGRDLSRCPACGLGTDFSFPERRNPGNRDRGGEPGIPTGPEKREFEPELGSDFAELVEPIVAHLVRVARRILGCDDLAWEAVQETLFCLWQRGLEPPNLRAWLVRSVIHRSLHLRRAVRRRREHEARACQVRSETTSHGDPLRGMLVEEARSELREALTLLPEMHRDVIVLHLWEGLDYQTIAVQLGIPIGTVRSRMSRAREALRASMALDQPDIP